MRNHQNVARGSDARMQTVVSVRRRVSVGFSAYDFTVAGGSVRMTGPSGPAGRILL